MAAGRKRLPVPEPSVLAADARSEKGEDDGERVPAADAEARRERSRHDFTFFRRTYFPHYCLVKEDSRLHRWLDEELPRMADSPEGGRLAVAAPRGEDKARLFLCFSCSGRC